MKILYFANARIPTEKAHGIQILKMAEAFSKNNATLELILPNRSNKLFKSSNVFEFYNIKETFKIKKLKCFDPVFLMNWGSGVYIKVQSLLFLISIFIFLIFKKDKSSYFFYTRDIYLLPCLNFFSKKVIWESHDLPKNINFYTRFINQTCGIVSITAGLKAALTKVGIPAEKIMVSPDGVELVDFETVNQSSDELRIELLLPLDKKIIMYTGHFYKWKGAEILAAAANEFHGDELFVFVGGNNQDLEKLKSKYQIFKNIVFLGYKPHSQIPKYLKAADILIIPNSGKEKISKNYTSPLKLFEYLAAGKPIIASDLPSLREVLDDSVSEFFEPDDSHSLAKKIKNLLIDSKRSKEISSNSLEKSRQYSWNSRANQILNFLNIIK